MSEVKHTPGEWYDNGMEVWSTDGSVICDCEVEMDDEECEANAARIVRCVNVHDDLLAALRGIVDWPNGLTADGVEEQQARLAAAHAAIAKATNP